MGFAGLWQTNGLPVWDELAVTMCPGDGEARDPLIHRDYLGSAPSSPWRVRGPRVPLSGNATGGTRGILALAGSA